MRIITLTCRDCGTIVAANELEQQRSMKCPRFDCDTILRFDDLPAKDRQHILENEGQYRL
jgi:uncharacterized paraquat-inducible protein A